MAGCWLAGWLGWPAGWWPLVGRLVDILIYVLFSDIAMATNSVVATLIQRRVCARPTCIALESIFFHDFVSCPRCTVAVYCREPCRKAHAGEHRDVCGKVIPGPPLELKVAMDVRTTLSFTDPDV